MSKISNPSEHPRRVRFGAGKEITALTYLLSEDKANIKSRGDGTYVITAAQCSMLHSKDIECIPMD